MTQLTIDGREVDHGQVCRDSHVTPRRQTERSLRASRRDARAKVVKLCGTCKGRGGPKGTRRNVLFYYWIWAGDQYREAKFYGPKNLLCPSCDGSGLNCSMQRAIELENAT
jgi:hypothetical protein